MSVEYIVYDLLPEDVDSFVAAYDRAAAHLRRCEHVLAYEVAAALDGSGRCVVRIEWDDPDGHAAFSDSDLLDPFLAELNGFLHFVQSMCDYEVTHVAFERT